MHNNTRSNRTTTNNNSISQWPWKKLLSWVAHDCRHEKLLTWPESKQREFVQLFVTNELEQLKSFQHNYIAFFENLVHAILWPKEHHERSSSSRAGSRRNKKAKSAPRFDSPWCLVGGMTQTGKTVLKCLILDVCKLLQIAAVITTKGVAESRELRAKLAMLQDYFIEDDTLQRMSCQDMCTSLKRHACLVVADTHAQIQRATQAIQDWKQNSDASDFLVMIDECDEMFRTDTSEQCMEEALAKLLSAGPLVEVHVSATPLPIILDKLVKEADRDFLGACFVEPAEDYSGLTDLHFLLASNNQAIFLDQRLRAEDELHHISPHIPYFNCKVKRLYDDAYHTTHQGALLIDCSSPYVTVERVNIIEKARRVQQSYPRACVVAMHAEGMDYWKPGKSQMWVKNELIGGLLEKIDRDCGLQTPIFLFGWSKIRRGISFRSNGRVPTHMLMDMGPDFSVESCIQCLGRATGNYKTVLAKNGVNGVVVLTNASDFDTARRYFKLVQEIQRRLQHNGMNLRSALSSPFPWHLDILAGQPRKIGRNQNHRAYLEQLVTFESGPRFDLSDEERREVCCGADYQKYRRTIVFQTLQQADREGEESLTISQLVDKWDEEQPFRISQEVMYSELMILKSLCRVESETKLENDRKVSRYTTTDRELMSEEDDTNAEQEEMEEDGDGDGSLFSLYDEY